MPLYPDAHILIRRNLRRIQKGKSARPVAIGTLSKKQLDDINSLRKRYGLSPIIAEVLFIGRHAYEKRVIGNGYTIDDVTDQICSAMNEASEFLESEGMTAIQNPNPRADRYGNTVNDRIVFECTSKHPRPEVFTVVPKGDKIKPAKR